VVDPIGAQDRLQVAMKGVDDYELVVIDCPPSLGLLTVNGLFAAEQALIVTEPAAWASDGVQQVLRTVERIGQRRNGGLTIAGISLNRLGRTRDAKYWYEQLVDQYGSKVLPPIHLRAAVAEASAQSLPIHALGMRAGAQLSLTESPMPYDPQRSHRRPQLADDAPAPIDALLAERDELPEPADAPSAFDHRPTFDNRFDEDAVDEIEVMVDRGRPRLAMVAIALVVLLLFVAWVRRRR
jgi:hypothetical protein